MERLKHDLIRKSTVIENENIKPINYSKRIKKIYDVAILSRGGQIKNEDLIEAMRLSSQFSREFILAQKIKQIIIKTIVFLKTKEENAKKLRLIFLALRLGIQFVLVRCKIQIDYIPMVGISPQVVITATCTGGTLGFIYGWFTAGILFMGPPTLLTALMIRSVAQQFMHNKQYKELAEFYQNFATDKVFIEQILENVSEIHKKVQENYSKISLENLNWNKNPEIKQTAECLGIFENLPKTIETLHINTLDSDIELY